MIASLAKFIDWYALQFVWTIRLRSLGRWQINQPGSRLDEALQFLNGPDFIPGWLCPVSPTASFAGWHRVFKLNKSSICTTYDCAADTMIDESAIVKQPIAKYFADA